MVTVVAPAKRVTQTPAGLGQDGLQLSPGAPAPVHLLLPKRESCRGSSALVAHGKSHMKHDGMRPVRSRALLKEF